MNLVYRKLAMLEQTLEHNEEMARINGYTTDCVDREFKNRVTNLLNQVRVI